MRRIAVFLIWLALGCGAAGAEEAPLPMLDTGGHMAENALRPPFGTESVFGDKSNQERILTFLHRHFKPVPLSLK